MVAVDTVDERLELARALGAEPVHLTEDDPRAAVKELTEGRGVDATIDAVGHPDALELACRLTRKAGTVSATGVYAERIEVHMGIVWIKALTLKTGHANVIKHVDPVLELLASGVLDPTPLVTHHMSLDEAPEAYDDLRPPRGAEDRPHAVSDAGRAHLGAVRGGRHAGRPGRRGRGVPRGARGPAWKLEIDFGPEIGVKRSSAQITNYERGELEDTLVVAVVNFPPKQIGPFMSECLVIGALDDERGVILLRPDREVALGDRIA